MKGWKLQIGNSLFYWKTKFMYQTRWYFQASGATKTTATKKKTVKLPENHHSTAGSHKQRKEFDFNRT